MPTVRRRDRLGAIGRRVTTAAIGDKIAAITVAVSRPALARGHATVATRRRRAVGN